MPKENKTGKSAWLSGMTVGVFQKGEKMSWLTGLEDFSLSAKEWKSS